MSGLPTPLILACVALVGSSASAAAADRGVAYSLSPEVHGDAITALDVEMDFRGEPSGTTRLELPQKWAEGADLWKNLRDLSIQGASAVTEEGDAVRVIRAVPGAPLHVRYRVVSAYADDPTAADSRQSAPVIRPGWFYAVGYALFAAPTGRDKEPATFAWRGPPAPGFASDLQHLAGPGRAASRPGTVADVQESIVIGGRDLRVTTGQGGLSRVRVATLGRYAFDDAQFRALAIRVIAAEREHWGDRDDAPFLVAMTPTRSTVGLTSFSGAGLSDAFALWVGEDIQLPDLRWLLAHEYFHTWNPRQLGGMVDGADEPLGYWFSEGFTDFYANRLLLRSGMFSLEDYAGWWNDVLLAYAGSPVRTASNARVAKDFWNDDAVQKLPYQRGALLAQMWDARLRAASGGKSGLDQVLRAQRIEAAAPGATLKAPELFIATAGRLGLDVRSDVGRFIEQGEPIVWPADLFGRCATVRTNTRPAFDRGYDADATSKADNVVTGLRPDTPAYAAGLRNGMKILARDAGKPGDSRVEYALRVKDAGAERVIRFKPEGRTAVTVQQVVISPGLTPAQRTACTRTMSGLAG